MSDVAPIVAVLARAAARRTPAARGGCVVVDADAPVYPSGDVVDGLPERVFVRVRLALVPALASLATLSSTFSSTSVGEAHFWWAIEREALRQALLVAFAGEEATA